MRRKHVVIGLVVVALVAGINTPAMAQIFPWWSFDSVLEEVQDRGTLRAGLGLFTPWSICTEDGELIGFEIDVAKKLAADMGVDVEHVPTDWNYILPSLIAEDFDAIISGMTILPHRNLRINFTSPYNITGIYLVANQELTADLETLEDYNSSDVSFATRRAASSIPAIEEIFPDAEIILFDNDDEILAAVVAGDAHAAAAFAVTRLTWVEENPDTLHLPFEEPFYPEALGMGVRKGDLDTLNFLNGWITVNETNGWLEERRQYWFDGLEWRELEGGDSDAKEECKKQFE